MKIFFKIFGVSFFVAIFLFATSLPDESIVLALTTTTATTPSNLQSQIDAQNQQINAINLQIAQYQVELQKIGNNKKTLQDAINSLNLQINKVKAQIALTQHQINATQLQIEQLGTGIADTQQTISTNNLALSSSIRSLQEIDSQPMLLQIFSTDNVYDAWNDVNSITQILNSIRNSTQILKTQKSKLTSSQASSKQQQDNLTAQKKLLTSQQISLNQTKQSENQLLVETKAQESVYQNLIVQAKAELNSFSTFTQSAGGSKLLTNQTSCDAWGCYYNQRDSAWGNDPLNGTSYHLASDGCLVTAMAMVMTHYGYRDVTPVTINSNPNNFAVYYPAYLMFTIYVDGISATRKTAKIDATLQSGNPVVVGLHAYGGTHFVVLTSGSRGNYLMRDPYIANGKDISFNSHYTIRSIYGISKVIING